jgi:hypothetical protein
LEHESEAFITAGFVIATPHPVLWSLEDYGSNAHSAMAKTPSLIWIRPINNNIEGLMFYLHVLWRMYVDITQQWVLRRSTCLLKDNHIPTYTFCPLKRLDWSTSPKEWLECDDVTRNQELLWHGWKDKFQYTDLKIINIKHLHRGKLKPDKCPALVNRPKLFFMQAEISWP